MQAELENSQGEEKDANASLTKLKAAHEGLSRRYEEVIGELAVEREERGANEANFVREMGAMRRLVEMLEKREEERKVRVEEVERGLEDERRSHEEREEELREKLSCERERSDGLELRCTEMREALERPSSYGRDDGDVSMSPGSFALSPSAQMAARGQKSGRSYAEVYGEYIRMEEELARERAESKRLGECLSQILGDIEERVRSLPFPCPTQLTQRPRPHSSRNSAWSTTDSPSKRPTSPPPSPTPSPPATPPPAPRNPTASTSLASPPTTLSSPLSSATSDAKSGRDRKSVV